ncbi:gamma-glutamyltransferase family protein [Paracoccus laeviglucosivorans]|uniref:Gamma-glutamyltranspeptidase / glutathione hydrolase n=1 Tax=Paracoccus laeviglucosivorans TaxID=1197861 RepID=A0A521E8Z2_9RHOB|nr:gamma-glutamyltransferase [Paracoccus laeviglucosivorans]SMO80418.1 gamma-glutamyltranspeptidase / glutathione hydrolase [Paracoccus laeviglucosivorans]
MNGAVVISPHRASAEAGADVLAQGGNAIEALVAAGAALAVTYPHFCGLGGDAVWMVADGAGAVDCYLGIGQAIAAPVTRIDQRGPGSMLTTAALVDSWDHVLAHSATWGGRAGLHELLQAAISLAEDGFARSASQKFWQEFRGDTIAFCNDDWLRQPELAQSLRLIARDGARSFYEGALSQRISRAMRDAGAAISADDLAATRTQRVAPLRLDYRGLTLCAPPPPTQGATTLQIMGILRALDMAGFAPDGPDFHHHLVEAVKQAFLDRPPIADPDFTAVDVQAMLGAPQLAAAASRISGRAMDWPQPWRQGDTAFLAAVDAQGRSACVLQSLYFDWGSGVMLGDTGILWQNRGAAFDLAPDHVNCIAPGKRPFYTLNPGMALKDGRPTLLYGTQGADGQPQTLSLLLSLLIDHGMSPAKALARPRFLLGRTFSDSRDTLKIEAGLPDTTTAALCAMGHELAPIPAFSPLGGQAGVVRIEADGRIDAAHDPRSDGGAIYAGERCTT